MPPSFSPQKGNRKTAAIPPKKQRGNRAVKGSFGILLEDAATRFGLSSDAFKKIFDSRLEPGARGKKNQDVRVKLHFDFACREILLAGGLASTSIIPHEHVEYIAQYLELRSLTRGETIIPVSDAFGGGKGKKDMEQLREFISTHLLLPPETELPTLLFSPKLPSFRANLREFNGTAYCEPRFSRGIIFASRLPGSSEYMVKRAANKLSAELKLQPSPKEVPFELGLKLWIANTFYQDNLPGISPFLKQLVSEAAEFFSESGAKYSNRFLDMDILGRARGRAQKKFWENKSPEEKMGYAKWLIQGRGIITYREFTSTAPSTIVNFIKEDPSRRETLGLLSKKRGRPRKNDAMRADDFSPEFSDNESPTFDTHPPSRSGMDLLQEYGIKVRPDSTAPLDFSRGASLFDPIEEPARDSYLSSAPRTKPFGSRFPNEKRSLVSWSPAEAHEEDIEIIFARFITWNRCPENEQEHLKKIIFREIKTGSKERITKLLAWTGVPLDIEDENGTPLLFAAAQKPKTGALEALLAFEGKLNLEQREKRNQDTALMRASFAGNTPAAELLAGTGAKLDARNSQKQTALMLAAWDRHPKTIRKLIELGADPTLKDKSKRTAADYAELSKNKKLAAELRKAEKAWGTKQKKRKRG